MRFRVIIFNSAVLAYKMIHGTLNVAEPFRIAGLQPDAFNAFQDHTLVITPTGGFARCYGERVGPQVHRRQRHTLRIRRFLGLQLLCHKDQYNEK